MVVRRAEGERQENGAEGAGPVAAAMAPSESVVAATLESRFAAVSAAEAMTLALSAAQRTAIERLTCGQTLVDSATAAGVSRMTLYRWLKNDVQFQAAYNAWQQDAVATARGRMLGVTDVAVMSLARALSREAGQPVQLAAVAQGRLALRVLERMGIADRPTPGPTEVEELERRRDLERRKHENLKLKEEFDVKSEEFVSGEFYGAFNNAGKKRDEKVTRRQGEGVSEGHRRQNR